MAVPGAKSLHGLMQGILQLCGKVSHFQAAERRELGVEGWLSRASREKKRGGSGPGVCLSSDVQDDTSGAGEAALSERMAAMQQGRAQPSGELEIRNYHDSPVAGERRRDSNQRWLNSLLLDLVCCARRDGADGTAAGDARPGEGI